MDTALIILNTDFPQFWQLKYLHILPRQVLVITYTGHPFGGVRITKEARNTQ
jgi:hypothetical protein